jgi:Protein of unknown function (DUF3723)
VSVDYGQEILNYLEHIRRFWHDLVDSDFSAMQKIDDRTVQVIGAQSSWSFHAQCRGRSNAKWSERFSVPSVIKIDYRSFVGCANSIRSFHP